MPIEIIADFQLPIVNCFSGGARISNRQLAIGNRQCSYVAA
jgi:hypothetical protein